MRILCITTVKDEAPYLLEWVAHHRAAGVTDFLVFSNDCSDGTEKMLKALQMAGIVRHIPQEKVGGRSVQWQALKEAWKHPLRQKADWVLVSDVDEFVNIKVGAHRFEDLINAVSPEADAIILQWRLFGHNGLIDICDAPVTEQFTRAIPPGENYPIAASLIKTLFKPNGPFNMLGVHRPRQKDIMKARRPIMVDGSGKFLPQEFAMNGDRISMFGTTPARELAEINHYAIKSAMGFLAKRARGLPNRKKEVGLNYWVERNFNTQEDLSISAMGPATRKVFDEFMRLPGIEALHKAGVAHHISMVQDMIKDPDVHKLLTQLVTAGSSEVVPQHLQKQLISWYHDAQKSSEN